MEKHDEELKEELNNLSHQKYPNPMMQTYLIPGETRKVDPIIDNIKDGETVVIDMDNRSEDFQD